MKLDNMFVLLAVFGIARMESGAVDLFVNNNTTVPGGNYGNIVVTNGGNLTIGGPLAASSIKIGGYGNLLVLGSLTTSSTIDVRQGQMVVTGTNNQTGQITVSSNGLMLASGIWKFDSLFVLQGGSVQTIPNNVTNSLTGTLSLIGSNNILVAPGGIISADYAGNDPRGQGGGFANAGGGGAGGMGGASYWSTNFVGQAFGDSTSADIYQGGAGGVWGGGALSLVAPNVVIAGSVHSNGGDGRDIAPFFSPGGGGGGGVLIAGAVVNVSGNISANGGNGTGMAGPGGGGWIKLFYNRTSTPDLLLRCSVAPGPIYPVSRRPAQAGIIAVNGIADPPQLYSPDANANVGLHPQFVLGLGGSALNATDPLTVRIEISKMSNFSRLFAVYDQLTSQTGWSQNVYFQGNTAIFSGATLPVGSYFWRAQAVARNSMSSFSSVRAFNVVPDFPAAVLKIENKSDWFKGEIVVSFKSENKRVYWLEISNDLVFWQDTFIRMTGDGNVLKFSGPATEPHTFYRLRAE